MLDWLHDCDSWGGCWGPWLLAAGLGVNLLIALVFFWIPVSLLWLYRQRHAVLPGGYVLPAFATFLLAAGVTHCVHAFGLLPGPWRLLLDVPCAAVAVWAGRRAPGTVLHLAGLPTTDEQARTAAGLDVARCHLDTATAELAERRARLEETDRELVARARQLDEVRSLLEGGVAELAARLNSFDADLRSAAWVDARTADLDRMRVGLQELRGRAARAGSGKLGAALGVVHAEACVEARPAS